MGSPRFRINRDEVVSAVRHTILPILAGGAIGALEAAQTGTVSVETMKTAGLTALISGVIRFLHKLTSNTQQ
jgi:hypothetical protein